MQTCRPVETRERHLERIGPVYKTPTVIQTLHNLPFLRHAPNRITEVRISTPTASVFSFDKLLHSAKTPRLVEL